MYLSTALVVSAWALQASAFLIPLEVSKAAQQAKAELAALLLSNSAQSLDLDCPGCPYFGNEKDLDQVQTDIKTKIHLEFAVDHKDVLTINGAPLASLNPHAPTIQTPHVVRASQIRVDSGDKTIPLRIDYAFEKYPSIHGFPDSPDASILPVRFTILAIEARPVKLDTVVLHLLRTPNQPLSLSSISLYPFIDTPGATTCPNTTMGWSLCRFRAIVIERLRAVVAAARARAHGMKGWVSGGEGRTGCKGNKHGVPPPGKMHHGGYGHGHGHPHDPHHRHHHHHHHAHRYGRIIYQTLRFFVIPALLGVIGGLIASAVGMLVGQFIVFLWLRYHRGGQRGNASQARVIEIIVDEDEKDELLAENDGEGRDDSIPPPEYRDVDVEAAKSLVENDELKN